MKIFKWTVLLSIWALIAAFFHYTLPQRDIVYIQGTEIIRQDFTGWNRMFYATADVGNNEQTVNRDLRLINATRANGNVIVYRNEDTGFGWPPYFKLDSSNLQAEAQNATSTRANPEWYLVTHYGWRFQAPTIYPNAVSLKPIAGPDVGKPVPWVNIIVLTLFFAIWYTLWVRWRRFRQANIDPTLEEWQDSFEAAGDAIDDRRGRVRRWLGTWRAK